MSHLANAQTSLNPGDILFIGVNSDINTTNTAEADELAIVTLVPIASGTTIYISDFYWDGSKWGNDGLNGTTLNNTEGIITWTTTSAITEGTVFRIRIKNGVSSTNLPNRSVTGLTGTVSMSGWNNGCVAEAGDTWHIYQGTNGQTPTRWVTIWTNHVQATSNYTFTNSNSAAIATVTVLPSTLTNNVNALSLSSTGQTPPHYDNMRYTGTRTGSRATLQAAICNSANWEGDEGTPYDLSPLGASFSTNFTLPIELTAFNAQTTEGGKTHLTWATGSEVNSHSFDIERSQDGKTFSKIGNVKAQGKVATYNFIDNPLSNLTYYRLKMIDNDSKFEYSKTISLSHSLLKGSIKIYPTTTKDVIMIENNGSSVDVVTIFNPMGQIVMTAKTTNRVDMSALPSGMYLVQVQAGQEKVVEKVFKQ